MTPTHLSPFPTPFVFCFFSAGAGNNNTNTVPLIGVVQGAFCVWTEPDLKRLLDAGGECLPGEGGQSVPVSNLFCR